MNKFLIVEDKIDGFKNFVSRILEVMEVDVK